LRIYRNLAKILAPLLIWKYAYRVDQPDMTNSILLMPTLASFNEIFQNIWNDLVLSHTLFLIRKPSLCLKLSLHNNSRNWALDFLKTFLTFTEMNWLQWVILCLFILYTRVWIPSLPFWCDNDVISTFSQQKHLKMETES